MPEPDGRCGLTELPAGPEGVIDRLRDPAQSWLGARLVEGMCKAQAQRLRALGRMPTTDELRSLLPDDVLVAAER